MKKYIVMRKYRLLWNNHGDMNDEEQWIITEKDIEDIATGWGKDKAELMKQVEEA